MVKRGDIIKVNLDPQTGHEQSGRRPALVVSNSSFTLVTRSAAMVCPITRTDKGLPFHIKLDNRTQTAGVILCDQAKIINIGARNFEFVEEAPFDLVSEAIDTITGFLEAEE